MEQPKGGLQKQECTKPRNLSRVLPIRQERLRSVHKGEGKRHGSRKIIKRCRASV